MASSLDHGPEAELLLPPVRARVTAFLVDGTFFGLLLIPAALGTELATPGATSVRQWVVVVAAVALVNSWFQAVEVWLSGGRSVGRSITRLCLVHADGSAISQTAPELARLVLRFSVGYTLFSVFLLATPWALRDPRRRCPHDIVMGTQVVQVNRDANLSIRSRVRAMEDDIGAGLAIVRERWGVGYRLVKWSSWFVMSTTAPVAAGLTKLGVLAPAVATTSTTQLPASAGASGMMLPVALGTSIVSAAAVTSGVVLLDEATPNGLVLEMTFDGEHRGYGIDPLGGTKFVMRRDAGITEEPPGNRALSTNGNGWLEVRGLAAQEGSVTVEALVLANGGQDGWATIVDRWTDGNYWLGGSSPAGRFEWWMNTEVESTQGVLRGSWQHVAGTYDASTRRLVTYVDGRAVGSARSPATSSEGVITVGGGDYPTWQGLIDDVRIWDSALSAGQVCAAARRAEVTTDC